MTPPPPARLENPSGSPLPALLLGLLLGLSILKLGNPVILEEQIGQPTGLSEWLSRPWPTRTGLFLLPLVAASILFLTPWRQRLTSARLPAWIWIALAGWLGWQVLSSAQSVDPKLTQLTLPHLLSIAVCFTGGVILGAGHWKPLLLGIGAGACLCWLQAFNQRTFEFRNAREALVFGQQSGWTNLSPAELSELRISGLVIQTNGLDIANPAILDKLQRARVHGSLVYPNALAGLVLLVLPVLAVDLGSTRSRLRPILFYGILLLLGALGLASLVWSGSRSGWLIAVAMAATAVLLHPSLRRFRLPIALSVLVLGAGAFGLRNRDYFKKGATSVSARFDYWKAALQNTANHPILGSGPGTFMRPYARLKAPEAEMARLVHNDYLQQFTDSGVPGGLAYLVWVLGSLGLAWGRLRSTSHPVLTTALLLGVSAWLVQGLSEFGLYVPPLAWTAFTLLGVSLGLPRLSPSTPPSPQPNFPNRP